MSLKPSTSDFFTTDISSAISMATVKGGAFLTGRASPSRSIVHAFTASTRIVSSLSLLSGGNWLTVSIKDSVMRRSLGNGFPQRLELVTLVKIIQDLLDVLWPGDPVGHL